VNEPTDAPNLSRTLSAFADRLFHTGGADPGDAALPLPADRLAVYRELLDRNYRAMLRFALTQTLRLATHVRAERGEAGGAGELVDRYLATSPPDTHSTRALAAEFAAFIERDCGDLVAERPDLPELMTLERAELRANYHEDDPGEPCPQKRLEVLAANSVEDFLALEILRAPSASCLRFVHPVGTLHAELSDGRFPPPERRAEYVTTSRHPRSLRPLIRVHEPLAGRVFELSAGAGTPEAVEALAARWMESLRDGERDPGEEALFALFAGAVVHGLRVGFFRLG